MLLFKLLSFALLAAAAPLASPDADADADPERVALVKRQTPPRTSQGPPDPKNLAPFSIFNFNIGGTPNQYDFSFNIYNINTKVTILCSSTSSVRSSGVWFNCDRTETKVRVYAHVNDFNSQIGKITIEHIPFALTQATDAIFISYGYGIFNVNCATGTPETTPIPPQTQQQPPITNSLSTNSPGTNSLGTNGLSTNGLSTNGLSTNTDNTKTDNTKTDNTKTDNTKTDNTVATDQKTQNTGTPPQNTPPQGTTAQGTNPNGDQTKKRKRQTTTTPVNNNNDNNNQNGVQTPDTTKKTTNTNTNTDQNTQNPALSTMQQTDNQPITTTQQTDNQPITTTQQTDNQPITTTQQTENQQPGTTPNTQEQPVETTQRTEMQTGNPPITPLTIPSLPPDSGLNPAAYFVHAECSLVDVISVPVQDVVEGDVQQVPA